VTGWALDLDGVVWLADRPVPGASEAVARLRRAGHRVLFVTNNSSVPVADVEAKLAVFGIHAEGDVVTSAAVAAGLVSPEETALVCAGAGVEQALLARGVTVVRDGDADVVVVGYHRDFTYERMTVASTALRRGARLLATNDDATYPTPEGPIPGGGAILASIVTASGVAPLIAGKPYAPMADHVRALLGEGGVMVGDRPDTDGRFARALGYRFVLVLSGVTAREDLPVEPTPDLVATDLAEAVDRLGGAPRR
jgi:HAD superfamily hydrolase (TIGR01450 family)